MKKLLDANKVRQTTIRLTPKQKRLLWAIADEMGYSITTTIKRLVEEEAERRNIQVPEGEPNA